MRQPYHAYMKVYRKKLDEVCNQIGIDAHRIKIISDKKFEKISSETINNKLLEMYHAGFSFSKNHRLESRNYLEDRVPDKVQVYKDTTIDKLETPIAGAHEIILSMHNSFSIGMAYGHIFKKRMPGREFLDKIQDNNKVETIYKIV